MSILTKIDGGVTVQPARSSSWMSALRKTLVMSMLDHVVYAGHGAKALSSKMTPRGALRAVSEVSAQIGKFSFFWVFEASKTKFRSNFADGARSRLSSSFSEMSLI